MPEGNGHTNGEVSNFIGKNPKSYQNSQNGVNNGNKHLRKKTQLFNVEFKADQCPIIYSHKYNISFGGIEKCHPFDCGKWGNIWWKLVVSDKIKIGQTVQPNQAKKSDLLRVHTERYLKSLKSSCTVAKISEICICSIIPNCILDRRILKPLRYQTGGSILGVKLAIERGWAINLGGGFHHAFSDKGSGFCFYADISLCVKFLLSEFSDQIKKVMICDLDAHQGNGHARDTSAMENVFILDFFNDNIFPLDYFAKANIDCRVSLRQNTEDGVYLKALREKLEDSLEKFKPDFVIYNAGTDILEGDPLGLLSITPSGVTARDEIVFTKCLKRNIPVLMLTSGGYTKASAGVVASSIINLIDKKIITIPQK